MTSLTLDTLKQSSDALTSEVSASVPHLTLIYAVHQRGQLTNTLHVLEDLILEHPAGRIARGLIKRQPPPQEPSALQGMAMTTLRRWWSAQVQTEILGLINLNVDQYDDFEEALFDLYHQTWQGLEMADLCQRPDMIKRVENRPIAPKRGPLGEAKASLRGDVFSALMMAQAGYPDAIAQLGRRRALAALSRSTSLAPENTPFVLAMEATDYAFREVFPELDARRPRLLRSKDITLEISSASSDEQIQHWWDFCGPAQDMAWRGYEPSEILAAALHTCEDPYVRAITHQIILATGLKEAGIEKLEGVYNPFQSMAENESAHRSLMQETFEIVLAQGLEEESSRPLLVAANSQNRDLLQGRFLGWCASALQAAAKAFDLARSAGKSTDQAAKLEFEIQSDAVSLPDLKSLSDDVIAQHRQGQGVTLEMLPALAHAYPALETLIQSVEQTLKDPGYRLNLDVVHELTRTFDPSSPFPKLGADFLIMAAMADPSVRSPSGPGLAFELTPGGPGGFLSPSRPSEGSFPGPLPDSESSLDDAFSRTSQTDSSST